jgi:hypothetical protein
VIQWFKALFSETGDVSMMRLLSLICVLSASAIGLKVATVGGDMGTAAVLCSTFLSAGIAGKVLQKKDEAK